MSFTDVVIIGFATGFLVWLLGTSGASPKGWQSFVQWFGKPFTCVMCMSFWIAIIIWSAYDAYNTAVDWDSLIQATGSAAISTLYVLIADRLNITILK